MAAGTTAAGITAAGITAAGITVEVILIAIIMEAAIQDFTTTITAVITVAAATTAADMAEAFTDRPLELVSVDPTIPVRRITVAPITETADTPPIRTQPFGHTALSQLRSMRLEFTRPRFTPRQLIQHPHWCREMEFRANFDQAWFCQTVPL